MPANSSAISLDFDHRSLEPNPLVFMQPIPIVEDIMSRGIGQTSTSIMPISTIPTTSMVIRSIYSLTEELLLEVISFRVPRSSSVIPDAIRANWQALATSGLSERAYLYLLKLAKKEAGWREPGTRPLEGRSLGEFLKFWVNVRSDASEPEFSLLPNGNLQVEWYCDDRHFTELEFRSNGLVLFGFFDGSSEIEGLANLDELKPLIASRDYRYLKWSQ